MQHPHYENSFCETGVPLELQSLYRFGIKLGLQNISSLLKSFYNPHHNMNFIHIAGTNGKGSTSAMINSIFIKHGFKTGLYTSPHLVDFRERFQINGKKIHPGELKKWVRLIMQILKKESIPGT
ncbi:MAG: bifunctional folylpolyglutamate synthase/dihydrofolate synthase, partial [Deltaproteobacteria bacterium CG_4_9_14_3_um_filter_44_9]